MLGQQPVVLGPQYFYFFNKPDVKSKNFISNYRSSVLPRKSRITAVSYYSRVLRKEMGPARYGDEETGTPPEEIYSKFGAENVLWMCCKAREVAVKPVGGLPL